MTGSDLGYIVRAMIDGVKVSEYQYEGRKIDLILRSAAHFTQRTQDVEHLSLNTVTGQLVTLGSLAHVQLVNGPEQINHIERQRAITIRVTPPADIALQTAMRRIEQDIVAPLRQQGGLGPADRIKLAGTADKLTTTRLALQGNLLLALIITFLLMAALFESFLYPFVIMFSVPLAAINPEKPILPRLKLPIVDTASTKSLTDILPCLICSLKNSVAEKPAIIVPSKSKNAPICGPLSDASTSRVRSACMDMSCF